VPTRGITNALWIGTPGNANGTKGLFPPRGGSSQDARVKIAGALGVLATALLVSWPCTALSQAPGQEEPWHVLILRSWDARFPANVMREHAMTEAILDNAPRVVEFYFEELDLLHFSGDYDAEFRALLRRKYGGRRLDLVIASGSGPLEFAAGHRDELWPEVPIVFNGVIGNATVTPRNATGITMNLDIAGTIELAHALVPNARIVHFVSGSGELDRAYRDEARAAMQRFDDLEARYMDGLTRAEMVSRVSTLGPESFVVYLTVLRDAAGQAAIPGASMVSEIAKASKVPVFAAIHALLAKGPVGGSSVRLDEHGRLAGLLARRVLAGEDPRDIPVRAEPAPSCLVDWRSLKRWGLNESRLPTGCEVAFRPQNATDPWIALGLASIVLLQAALIGSLVLQRRDRRRAQALAEVRRSDMAHAARLSTMGVLTASIAHEINQPLGAILSNADAAEIMLESGNADPQKLAAIIADVKKEDIRASEVVRRLRSMLSKHETQHSVLDVNVEAADALQHLVYDAARRNVRLMQEFSSDVPAVTGDPVQLQQVIVNLVINAMEAVDEMPAEQREVRVETHAVGGGVEVAIADTGPGLPKGKENELFESFFTTKPEGMGLGLSLVRTIVEAHRGRVSATSGVVRGAVFRIWLPAAGT
jgi:signal transduction histidine kinase